MDDDDDEGLSDLFETLKFTGVVLRGLFLFRRLFWKLLKMEDIVMVFSDNVSPVLSTPNYLLRIMIADGKPKIRCEFVMPSVLRRVVISLLHLYRRMNQPIINSFKPRPASNMDGVFLSEVVVFFFFFSAMQIRIKNVIEGCR